MHTKTQIRCLHIKDVLETSTTILDLQNIRNDTKKQSTVFLARQQLNAQRWSSQQKGKHCACDFANGRLCAAITLYGALCHDVGHCALVCYRGLRDHTHGHHGQCVHTHRFWPRLSRLSSRLSRLSRLSRMSRLSPREQSPPWT